jgi:general L-amino acid transport system permease protein
MAELSPRSPRQSQESIPFWRDIRVLGVIAQIIVLTLVILAAAWILGNVAQNLQSLGGSQFLCRDGSSSIRCAFDFLRLDASFDISEALIDYDPSDAYRQALWVGLLNTLQVSILGIIFATILGTFAGIARLSDNWLINKISGWYIDLMRNTPLLLQLLFILFGVILLLPPIDEAYQPFGLPIYLSQRGINLPWPVAMPSYPIWLAYFVAAVLVALVLWLVLGRLEERSGRERNRPLWILLAMVIILSAGWIATSAFAENQGILVWQSLRVREFGDLEAETLRRLGIADLSDLDTGLESGVLTEEDLAAAALRICAVREDPAADNLTALLRSTNIPYEFERFGRTDQATEAFITEECEVYVGSLAVLAGQRVLVGEDSQQTFLIPIPETPIRISVPAIEGLNFVGGLKISPNFAAILIGLVLYTGAFIAEIVRAGIQSVPKGQSEAARSLGLSEGQRLRLIILPQALRVIIPPMTSQYLNLAKNSSLAIAVGYPDLWSIAFTTLNQSGRPIQVFVIVMGVYLTISLAISFVLNWYNRRIALVER